MERWVVGKLEFLAWWAVSGGILAGFVGLAALVLNWLTGGAFATLIGVIAIIIMTIIGTLSFIWTAFWVEVK